MPRHRQARPPDSDGMDSDDAPAASSPLRPVVTAERRQGGAFKMISELIAETDRNLPDHEIEAEIKEFSKYTDVASWQGIPMHFEALSSLSRRASTYENWENRFKIVDYLVVCFGGLKEACSDYIANYFELKENGEEHVVDVSLVNAVSMFVILVQRLTVQLQLHYSKTISAQNQLKGRAKVKPSISDDLDKWKNVQRKRMINCLVELLELEVDTVVGTKKKAIQYMFAPDTMEPDFVMRFMDTVTQLLEDPDNVARANQPWIGQYFRIWKILAADYGMATQIANSLFTDTLELTYLETANTFPFIEPLVNLMKESSNGQVRIYQPLRVVFEMVVRRACAIYSGNRSDRPPPKAFCMIIQSLAVNVHDLMLQELTKVYQLLHNPHPNVRISCLQALADMFSSPYLSLELCERFESRSHKRMSIFMRIVAHTNDEATNVRAKAVSLLRNLMENRRIPEHFESLGFITIVGRRMSDKSVQVRKSAIQFLTMFLDQNRHGHDFNRKVHLAKLNVKTQELKHLTVPGSKCIQEAEAYFTKHSLLFKKQMRKDIIAVLKGEIRVDPNFRTSITGLMQNIFGDNVGLQLLKYYVAKNTNGVMIDETFFGQEPPAAEVDRIFDVIINLSQEDFINFRLQMEQNDPDKVIENEQAQADKEYKMLQLRAQIQQLIDKMCIEVELSQCVEHALRCVLMGDTAEIKEGIKFLTRCKLFEITGAESAIRSMCSLVWRPGSDVINELIDAAEDMFISRLDGSEKVSERDKSTVENLMKAMEGVTEKDRPSVEEVIFLLASVDPDDEDRTTTSRNVRKRRTIETTVICRLWNIALDSSTGGNSKKIDALRVLYPISRTEKGIPEARNRLRSLQKKLTDEPAIAVEALRIISILSTPTRREKEFKAFERPLFRIQSDDSLFKSLERLFFHEVIKASDDPTRDWFGIIRYTIATILNVSMDVNQMLPRLAAAFVYRAKKISEFYIFYSKQAEESADELRALNAARRRDYWSLTWCRVMEKLMTFCGEVAVQLHAFIQVAVPKLHNRYVTKMLEAEKNDANIREEPVRFLTDLEKSVAQRKTIFAVPIDTTPGTASNELNHLMSVMCDKRLFLPSKLLGRLLPIVVYGMRTKTMPKRIRQAAVIAFGKFMPLSAEVSAFAAPSFFSALTKSPSTLVRCNLIAACCDFAFAQPTLFELYAPSLFRMSQDIKPEVRESAILVLAHLLSNDMIQTRGVLSEPARCICDPARPVKEVAQSFFRELNSRTDSICHLLPEFLFRLSCNPEERMPFKSYKIVFEFLIQLLKEKPKANTEPLLDRVCLKFASIDMNDTEAPRYLLVALSKFAQNDGGLHRLQDNWRHWSKFLCHPQVAKEYRLMIEHLESTSKNEDFKNQCHELIKNIEKIAEEGLSNEDMAQVPTTSRRGGRRVRPAAAILAGPTFARNPKRRRRVATPLSEESDTDQTPPQSDGDEDMSDS